MIIIDEIFEGFYLIYEITIGTILEGIHNLFWLLAIVGIIAAPIYFYNNVAKHREAERIAKMVEYVIPAPNPPKVSHFVGVLSQNEARHHDISRFVQTPTSVWPSIDWVSSQEDTGFCFVGNDRYHNIRKSWVQGKFLKIGHGEQSTMNGWQVTSDQKYLAFICPGRRYYDFQLPDTIYVAPVSDNAVRPIAVAHTYSELIRWSPNGHRLYFTSSAGPWRYDPKNSSIRVSRGSVSTTTELRYINWQ